MLTSRHVRIIAVLGALFLSSWPGLVQAESADDAIAEHSRSLIFGSPETFQEAVSALQERGSPDVAPAMILALRYNNRGAREISDALAALTGHPAAGWFEWMVWQEEHPEITPHDSFAPLKLEILSRIDQAFLQFFPDAQTLADLRIRLEEITWGGVAVDGIPSLDNPKLIAADAAEYLRDDDLVFGVEINGDARAYPLRIMGWHEMFNEVIGGVPVALAYCTLCGSGILFETQVEGRERPLIFGSSGLLYRSNKLMFDRETNSLWNQFTGRPVSGPLVDSGIALRIRPVVITSWRKWRDAHPDGRVLSVDTGHRRDYSSGVVYREYFASPELMFPAAVDETLFRQKDLVFGIRDVVAAKAWPLSAFAGGAVVNDRIGQRPVVLVGDAATRTVRAYDRGDRRFDKAERDGYLRSGGADWRIDENALIGSEGMRLARVPGHVAYWFAWNGYLGVESEIYDPER